MLGVVFCCFLCTIKGPATKFQKFKLISFSARLDLGALDQFQGLGQLATEIGMHMTEVLDSAFLYKLAGIAQMASHVGDQTLACCGIQNIDPEIGSLTVIVLGIARAETIDIARHVLRGGQQLGAWALLWTGERVGEIVGNIALIIVDTHGTITLLVLYSHTIRAIDLDLLIVGAQTMTMSIRVGEQTAL